MPNSTVTNASGTLDIRGQSRKPGRANRGPAARTLSSTPKEPLETSLKTRKTRGTIDTLVKISRFEENPSPNLNIQHHFYPFDAFQLVSSRCFN